MSLQGYINFDFGEGLKDKPYFSTTGLYERGQKGLRLVWDQYAPAFQWEADSIGFRAHFQANAQSPDLETQTAAVAKFFSDEGIKILKTNAKDEQKDGLSHTSRIIDIKLPINEVEKAKLAIRKLETAAGKPSPVILRNPSEGYSI